MTTGFGRGVAQSGLAHLTGGQGVAGSNPVAPTIKIKSIEEKGNIQIIFS